MSEEARNFSLVLTLRDGYEFDTDFELPGVDGLLLDEPAPLGSGAGPNASRVLAAAVGNCLGASLLFCLRRARVPVDGMRVHVDAALGRNEQGRLRIDGIDVRLEPTVALEDRVRMERCLGIFEDFCIVTQSVRGGIDVDVSVEAVTPHAELALSAGA